MLQKRKSIFKKSRQKSNYDRATNLARHPNIRYKIYLKRSYSDLYAVTSRSGLAIQYLRLRFS